MALFISEQVAAVTAYNAGNPQFTVYYGENAAEAARQAQLAQGYAVDAATSAAYAGGFQTPEYATRAAGEAATTVGQVFRVPLNTSPQTFAWYRRAAIDSDGSSLGLDFTTATFESYALSEEVSPIGAVDSGYLVKGNGLTTPVSASIIYDSGTNIGIGTTSPGYALDVIGDFRATTHIVGGAAIVTGNGISTGDVVIELGGLRTGSGNAYMDWHATAGTDFESRIIRYGGANGGMDIINLGSGGMVLSQEGAAPIVFKTTATERMRIDSSGNLLLGTTTTKNRLTVTAGSNTNAPTLGSAGGVAYFTNSDVAYGLNVGTSAADGHAWLQAQRTDGTATAYNLTLNEAGGNVGIGTTAPAQKLHMVTTAAPTGTTQSFVRVTADVGYGADFGGGLIQGVGSIATISTVDAGTATERVRVKSGGQVRFVPLASAPSGAEAGDVYYDSGTNKLRCYNGTTWNDLF